MRKIITKRIMQLMGMVALLIISIVSIVYGTTLSKASRQEMLSKASYSLYKATNTNSRICEGEGVAFSCENAFTIGTNTKSSLMSKAKYLYLKFTPQGTNIGKVRLDFTPSDITKEFTLNELLIVGVDANQTYTTAQHNVTGEEVTLGTDKKYRGYQSFTFDWTENTNHLESITTKGLTNGVMTMQLLSKKNEIVATQTINTKADSSNKVSIKDSIFTGLIKRAQISNVSFGVGDNTSISRVFKNGIEIPLASRKVNKEGTSISIEGGEERVIELITTGDNSFATGSFTTEGIDNFDILISTAKIDDPVNVINNSLYVKNVESTSYTVDLNKQYFDVIPLLRSDDTKSRESEFILSSLWENFNDRMMVDKAIDIDLTLPQGLKIPKDFFHLKTNRFSASQDKFDGDKNSSYNTELNKLIENNPNITNVSLSNINIGNNIKLVASSLVELKLNNTNTTSTSFIVADGNLLGSLNTLDLSLNTLDDSINMLKNLKNLTLETLILSGVNMRGDSLLSFISDATLKTLGLNTNLKKLDLSKNQFDVFPTLGNTFSALEELDLSGNKIQSLASFTTSTNPLKSINVSDNNLSGFKHANFSDSLKGTLVELNISKNSSMDFNVSKDVTEVSYPELKTLIMGQIMIDRSTFVNWNKIKTPKLDYLDVSNTDLIMVDSIALNSFLKSGKITRINLSNTNITTNLLTSFLESISENLVNLDFSKNTTLSRIPTLKFDSLKKLDISETSFQVLPDIKSDTLVAKSLNFVEATSLSDWKTNFNNLELEGSNVYFSTADHRVMRKNNEILKNVNLKPSNVSFYDLTIVSVNHTKKKMWFENLLKSAHASNRENLKLEEKKLDLTNLGVEKISEPVSYQKSIENIKFQNISDQRQIFVDDLEAKVNKFTNLNTLPSELENDLKEKINVSFQNYGVKWTKSYLAAVTLAPIMLMLFIGINLYFAYHNSNKRFNKSGRKKWGKKKIA